MNKSNLSVGMVFKSYRDLCKALSEEIKGGDAKKSQLKEWERHFKYDRQGHKFIITEIYNKPKPIKSKKVDDSVYIKHIEFLLANELYGKEGGTFSYTKADLFGLLGMAEQFNNYDNWRLAIKGIPHIPFRLMLNYYRNCHKKLSETLFSSLNSMRRRGLLDYNEQTVICDDDGSRVADEIELRQLNEAENEVMGELEYNKKPAYSRRKFYRKLNEKLLVLYGWRTVHKEYTLVYNGDSFLVDKPASPDVIAAELKNHKAELSIKVLEAMKKQIKYQHSKYCKNENQLVEDCENIYQYFI